MKSRLERELLTLALIFRKTPTARAELQRQLVELHSGGRQLVSAELAEFIETRCGARTRKGSPCRRKGNGRGGRCSNHGGLSTGPRTPEGRRRSLENLVQFHGESHGP